MDKERRFKKSHWISCFLMLGSLGVLFFYLYSPQLQVGATSDLPGTDYDDGKTIVYRDTWGVPHIYAPNIEAGLFATGWVQAQDRPDELLSNMLMGMGELASVQGPGALNTDKIALMCSLYDGSKAMAESIDPLILKHVQSYVKGINHYLGSHPEDIPVWWGKRKIDVFMVFAFSRLFLQTYSFDGGLRDIIRAGITPDIQPMSKFSNQFVISPERSACKAPILLSDIHLPWDGPYRLWEFRIHAATLNGSGFTLPGIPFIFLGHNENIAWSITTGGPDCADAYKLKLNVSSGNPPKYMYDGQWKDIKIREYKIKIKGVGEKTLLFFDSHLGPINAIVGGTAYTVKSSYVNEVNVLSSLYALIFAKNIDDIKAGLSKLQLFPCNLMAADNSGDVYYQRTGRVPKRPAGYDFSKPVDGSTSKTEWLGIHSTTDLLQVTNPPQGYMQNCNVPPDAMMENSPFQLKNTIPYIFADMTQQQAFGYSSRDGWTNSRGARVIELLKSDNQISAEKAMAITNDIIPFGANHWVEALIQANEKYGSLHLKNPDYLAGIHEIKSWNFELAANSKSALKYAYWKMQLMQDIGSARLKKLSQRVVNLLEPLGKTSKPFSLNEDELKQLVNSFAKAITKLKLDFGSVEKTYGEVFRIGRGSLSWPCEGGMAEFLGLTTVRSVQYGPEQKDHTRWAQSGQTSTGIVVLSKPIQSWTCVPFGQSNHPASPHYSDQAEKLFSPRKMKPTWWTREELAVHIESRTLIDIK